MPPLCQFQGACKTQVDLLGLSAELASRDGVQRAVGVLCGGLSGQGLSTSGTTTQKADKAAALAGDDVVECSVSRNVLPREGKDELFLLCAQNERVECFFGPGDIDETSGRKASC